MQKKINAKYRVTYFTQNYQPEWEAISKEIEILHKNFNSSVFSLNTSNPFSMAKIAKLPFTKSEIYHIYTSVADRLFLPVINKRPLILTGSASSKREKIERLINHYDKVDAIVVESDRQKKILLDIGIEKNKVQIIYPGIDLTQFRYRKPVKSENFKILFASSPPSIGQMKSRGLEIILKCASSMIDLKFTMMWRNVGYRELVKSIEKNNLKNMEVFNRVFSDMQKMYNASHCTIAPFLNFDEDKPVPRSIIESLACGRPVLVSDRVGISDLIKREKCGIVFDPTYEEATKAIHKIKKNYLNYQKNARKVAEKYFSEQRFVKEYENLYKGLL